MVFTTEMLLSCISSCEERIISIQSRIDSLKVFTNILSLVTDSCEKKVRYNCNREEIKNYENNIKLINVEKLIYKALGNKDNSKLFPKLFQKYSELMTESYDMSGNMVKIGAIQEQEYLEFCSQSLAQRDYVRKMCFYGETRHYIG